MGDYLVVVLVMWVSDLVHASDSQIKVSVNYIPTVYRLVLYLVLRFKTAHRGSRVEG